MLCCAFSPLNLFPIIQISLWCRMWHSWKFRHKRISEYIRIKKFTRTNVWIYSYKKIDWNECPNKYSYWKLCEYSNILEYSSSFYTLTHSQTNVRIYSYKQIWHEWISEYIRIRKFGMNECPNKYLWPKYLNIRILKYIRHTLLWWSTPCCCSCSWSSSSS